MDLTQTFEEIIQTITGLMSELEGQAFQQAGFGELSMRQALYLETIAQLGQPTFGELAEALKVTRPSVTAIVARLIQKGLVRRVQSDQDRRSYRLVLTEKGLSFSRIHAEIHRRIAQELISRIEPADVEQLANLLHKMTH